MQRLLFNSSLMFACALPALALEDMQQVCAWNEDTSLLQNIRAGAQEQHQQQQTHRHMSARSSKNMRQKHASNDHAKINVADTADYRNDAAMYLKQALELSGGRSIQSRCGGLTQMSLGEVEGRWLKQRRAALDRARAHTQTDIELAEETVRTDFNDGLDSKRPVVVQGVVDQLRWPAATRWKKSQLVETLRHQKFHVRTFDYPSWIREVDEPEAEETLDEYLDLNQSARNLFLFASETGYDDGDVGDSKIVDIIRDDFSPHPMFAFPPEAKQAIFAIDGIGSSHGFHAHDPVWQVQVEGYKMWYLLPPDAPNSQGNPSDYTEWGSAPLVGDKPFAHPNGCAMLAQYVPPPGTLTCLVAPGEMILLPTYWLHATCGLSNYTASAGGWLGPPPDAEVDDDANSNED